ncbi:MAG TPA: YceI family protein [Streptosporangiaceae bacterium]|nr:YceI family protein [Streptosporangiaceae bacterium]
MTVDAGTYQLGPAAGRVAIRTGRAGLAARAGHDLLIEVTRWTASVTVGDDLASASVTAELDLGSLAVREGTGGAKPLTAKDRADIEKTMSKILGAGSATFTSTRVAESAVEGSVTYRGRTMPLRLEVTEASAARFRGTASVAQTAFGITPYTGFFGALKLRDEVTVEFDVDLGRATRG